MPAQSPVPSCPQALPPAASRGRGPVPGWQPPQPSPNRRRCEQEPRPRRCCSPLLLHRFITRAPLHSHAPLCCRRLRQLPAARQAARAAALQAGTRGCRRRRRARPPAWRTASSSYQRSWRHCRASASCRAPASCPFNFRGAAPAWRRRPPPPARAPRLGARCRCMPAAAAAGARGGGGGGGKCRHGCRPGSPGLCRPSAGPHSEPPPVTGRRCWGAGGL